MAPVCYELAKAPCLSRPPCTRTPNVWEECCRRPAVTLSDCYMVLQDVATFCVFALDQWSEIFIRFFVQRSEFHLLR